MFQASRYGYLTKAIRTEICDTGTPPALQIAAENFPAGGVVPSESGELSKDGHRPSKLKLGTCDFFTFKIQQKCEVGCFFIHKINVQVDYRINQIGTK